MYSKTIIKLITLIFSIHSFMLPIAHAKQQSQMIPYNEFKSAFLSAKQLTPLFSKFKTAGSLLDFLKKLAPAWQIKLLENRLITLGMKRSDLLPTMKAHGKWIKFQGVKKSMTFQKFIWVKYIMDQLTFLLVVQIGWWRPSISG